MMTEWTNSTVSFVDDDKTMDTNNGFSTDVNSAMSTSWGRTGVFSGYGWDFWAICFLSIIIIGTVANSFMLAVLVKDKRKKTSTTVYLGAMAGNDIICLNLNLIYSWLHYLINYDVFQMSWFGCKFMDALSTSTDLIRAWLVTALTIERLIYLYFPRMIKLFSRRMTGIIVISFVVFGPFLLNIHYIIRNEWIVISSPSDNTTYYYCNEDMKNYNEFIDMYERYIFFFFGGICPSLCILIGNAVFVKALCRSVKTPVSSGQRHVSADNRDMIVCTIMISIMFLSMDMPRTLGFSFDLFNSYGVATGTIWLFNLSLKCYVYILYTRKVHITCI